MCLKKLSSQFSKLRIKLASEIDFVIQSQITISRGAISMKIIIILATLFSLQSGAENFQPPRRETIFSRGYASGFCDGSPSSWFCYDQLKRRSDDDAARDADWQCRARRGRIEMFSGSCSNFCNPYSVPQNAPSQYVNCNSNCTSTCLIESTP